MKAERVNPLPFASNPTEWTFGCLLVCTNDMEAYAVRYNRWYAKAHPAPLAADGRAYRVRCLARRRRQR